MVSAVRPFRGSLPLTRVQDTGDNRYRLGAAVPCDWTRFQRLARTGLARHDADGDLALRRALALVRGRPFTGIDPQRYVWAEPAIQEMVSTIVDVAHELSSRRCEAGDCTGALWSARQGLLAAEESEMLHRQVFLAHHAAGDIDAMLAAAARLARINEQLGGGVDMQAQTAELLRNLLPRTVTGPGEGRRNSGRCLAAQLGLLQATARIPMPPSRTSRQQRGHPFPQVIRRQLGRHPKDPAETTPNCQVPQRTSL